MQAITANWIWLDTDLTESVFARARKVISLEEPPIKAELAITCAGQYQLFINGRQAGRGPATALPARKKVDVIDVTDCLREGENLMAVKLVHHGFRTAHCFASPGGFLFQLDVDGLRFVSDESWRMALDPCFQRNHNRRQCRNYGIIEMYDARLEEPWLEVEFDDAAWPSARLVQDEKGLTGPCVAPWTSLMERRIPPCRETELRAVNVVRVAEVQNVEFHPITPRGVPPVYDLAQHLALEDLEEPCHTRVRGVRQLLEDNDRSAIVTQPSPLDQDTPEQYCAVIILDMGREITGYGWIDVEGNADAIIDVSYGERLRGGKVPAYLQEVSYADRYILRAGRQRHEVYDWKGYRYVQLTIRHLTEPLHIYGVGTTFRGYPVEDGGAFACSDELTTRIWATGAYTQQLCTHEHLMDCPWREQQEWLGDGRVQLLVLQNAFGNTRMTRNFLRNFADVQQDDGRLPMVSSYEHGGQIVDYSLWWVQGVLDVLRLDHDRDFAREQLPVVEKLLEWFAVYAHEGGLLENTPDWIFIDWADVKKKGACASLNAIYLIALDAAATVAAYCGEQARADRWRQRAAAIRASYHQTFWNDDAGFYVDCVIQGEQVRHFSQHTQAITVLAGLVPGDPRHLMQRLLDTPSLVRTEPYFSFYLCEALAVAGLAEAAHHFILEKWGAMIRKGATSFWEEWQIEGTFRNGIWNPRPRSHCHAWSAAPTAWLSRYVLGVRCDDLAGPITIAPQPCGLTWARGRVATACGPVDIAWRRDGQDLVIDLVLPPGADYRLVQTTSLNTTLNLRRQDAVGGYVCPSG